MDPLRLTPVSNTRYSITLQWAEFKEPSATYRLQLRERASGWTTKYWGHKTQVEVGGLGPEECYHFRVGVITPDESLSPLWSKTVPANTKDDFILVANLHRNAKYGNVNAVRKFINSRPGALDWVDQLGRPPLALAAEPQVTALLLNSGASIDLPARFTGRTPLMHAASQGNIEVASLLVERGASWDVTDRVGCTALHYAVDTSQLSLVELAISSGANLDTPDSCGWSPLLRGVVLGSDVGVLRLLLNAGADTQLRDNHGLTALQLAVLGHRAGAAKLLLEGGGTGELDPLALIAIATANGDSEIESLLKQHCNTESSSRKGGRSTPALSTLTTQ